MSGYTYDLFRKGLLITNIPVKEQATPEQIKQIETWMRANRKKVYSYNRWATELKEQNDEAN